MIRLFSAFAICATALLAASCCCTSDVKPPKLRALPKFQEISPAVVEETPIYNEK